MSLAAAAAGMRAGAVGLAGVVVSKVVGGAATTAPDASSPHGFVVHFLDDEDVKSREELMVQALERLRAARAQQTNATLSSPRIAANDRKRLERTSTANDTWLKIYALMDYNHDHVLHTHEIIKGIQMIKHAWRLCAEKLWPVELLPRDQRMLFRSTIERMCPRLDDVQALAIGLSEGDQLSWSKSTHFIQELEAHPSRKSFNRRRILSVLCDEYLAAIVIPTLQSWLDVFTLIDWNHSRTLGFHELKQGLCACNTPEVNLMQSTADIKSVVSAASERLLKDKFFRIATSMFEQSAVDRMAADTNSSKITCRQAAVRHSKIWRRISTAASDNFMDDVDILYDTLDLAISQDDVDQVEACLTRVRNRICYQLGQLRKHVSWLKLPMPQVFTGDWINTTGDRMHVTCNDTTLFVKLGRAYCPVHGVCRDCFSLVMAPGRLGLASFHVLSDGILEERRVADSQPRQWRRQTTVGSPTSSCHSELQRMTFGVSTGQSPRALFDATNQSVTEADTTRRVKLNSGPILPVDDTVTPPAETEAPEVSPRSVLTSVFMDEGLSAAQFGRVVATFTTKSLILGAVIFAEGAPVTENSEFSIVEEGTVSVVKGGVEVCELGRGECFGELAMISGQPRKTTVVAKSEHVRLLSVERRLFWAAVAPANKAENTNDALCEVKQQLTMLQEALQAQCRSPKRSRKVLRATEIDIMSFEEAAEDLNELASASWRALTVCKQLVATRQTTAHASTTGATWRLNALLVRVVKAFRANRIARVKAEFGPHEDTLTRVQARIRGFLERRRLQRDDSEASIKGTEAAKVDIANIADKELEFWDWPRVLEHCYMWHVTKESAERCSTSMCFPEVLLQKEIFNKKMNHFKQAMQAWNELFTIMDTDSNGSVSPDELKCALLAFSNMGLIAETPTMQPLNCDNEPFVKVDPQSCTSGHRCSCCSGNAPIGDSSGKVGPFDSGEIMLLGGEGVPMTGSWGIDLEFQLSGKVSADNPNFHCLLKSYSGDAIVACIPAGQHKLVIFVAPKAVFEEQTEVSARLAHIFNELDESRYLADVTLDTKRDPCAWYRLLIVGQPVQDGSINTCDWVGPAARMPWDGASFTNAATPGLAGELRIGAHVASAKAAAAAAAAAAVSPASSLASLRTPLPSPLLPPHSALRQRPSLGTPRDRRASFSATPRIPLSRQKSRRMSQVLTPCDIHLTPKTPVRARPKLPSRSRRLSICSAGSPAESDGWSEEEDVTPAASTQTLSLQKLRVYISTCGEHQPQIVMHDRVWQGHFEFFDCYSLGNCYDAVCSRADARLNWTLGQLRNFKVFGIDQDLMAELDARGSNSISWLDKAIDLASSDRDGCCTQEAARTIGLTISRGEDDDVASPSGGLLRTTSRGRLTPRGRPARMSSRFVLSPRSPRSPFPLIGSPSVVSPAPSTSANPGRDALSSYKTLANKLKNSYWNRKAENKAGVAVKINKQPVNSLLWFKYRLIAEETSVTIIESAGADKSKASRRPGYVWKNLWERDLSPGFQLSNGVVYREDHEFQVDKVRRTQRLVRSAYKALTDDMKQNENYWNLDGNMSSELLIDGAKFFLIRGDIAKRDPGLNSMFTGKQVKHASRAVQRQLRVNSDTLKRIMWFFILPPRACLGLVEDAKRWCCYAVCNRAQPLTSRSSTALKALLTHIFRTRRRSPRVSVLAITCLLWVSCIAPLCAYIWWDDDSSPLYVHGIEIFINTTYYLWAMLCIATIVASEVRGIPGRVSYKQSALKSEVASKPCSLTKISDGMPITTSAMAIVQMVCRQHHGEGEEDEEEEGEEDEGGMDYSTKLLRLFWQQDDAGVTLPWLRDQMLHDDELCDLSRAQLNRLLVFEFQMKSPPRDKNDWIYNLNIAMQGVQSKIDVGRPKRSAKIFVGILALAHGFLGLLHRVAFRGQLAFGEGLVEHVATTLAFAGTSAMSYIVYGVLLSTGMKWWIVHLFLKQTHSAIIVEEAITSHLPCYMDLRNKGNLDSWYTARQYLQEETNTECFAHKDQLPIAVALAFCAGLSVNALTNYFGDAGAIDFSSSPGILISLFNLVVIGLFLMISMMALEKINMETSVLLRKMNQVAVELGKSLEDNVYDRMSEEERAKAVESAQLAAQLATSNAPEHLQLRLADLNRVVNELQVREKLLMEQQFLLSIVQELRDTKSTKKIFGFAVDRNMLTKLFAGIGTCIYIILKEYFTALVPGISGSESLQATPSSNSSST